MSTFLKRIQCLTQDETVSAQRAVDFYEGDQTRLMRETLNTKGKGIKHWFDKGVLITWVNYVNDVIRQSAHTYDTQPTREIFNGDTLSEDLTEAYKQLLIDSGFDFVSQGIDELARLLKSTLLLVQWVEETGKYSFVLLARHNCDVQWDALTGTVKDLLYATCDAGQSGGQMIRHITPTEVKEWEFMKSDGVTDAKMTQRSSMPNPYDIVPAAPFFDVRQPTAGFWSKPAWEDLVNFNEAKNMFHIEAKFGSRFGLMGMPVTNATIPDGTIMSPDSIVKVEQTDPDVPIFFEFRAPQVQIDSFLPWLDGFTKDIGRSWGVSFESEAGQGSADSGFKLVVKELPNTELRQTRRKSALQFEQGLFNVLRTMQAVDSPSAKQIPPDAKLTVEFTSPLNVINKVEESEIRQKKIAGGTMSRRRAIMEENPTWTPEDADEELVLIDADRKAIVIVPEFGE